MDNLETLTMYAVPTFIGFLLIVTFVLIKRSREMRMLIYREKYLRSRLRVEESKQDLPRPIRELLKREDVTLRLLEKVHESENYRYRHRLWHGSPDAMRLTHLEEIE